MTSALRYRSAPYTPVPAWRRWWPLCAQEFGVLWQSRWGIALFCVCLFPAIGRLVMLLILFGVVNFGPNLRQRMASRRGGELAQFDPHSVEFYLEPVVSVLPGMVFALLLTSFVVARSVARDRPTNALELYWTRGITPAGYLLGKWLGGALLLGLLTVGVPLALWLAAILLAEDWSLLAQTAPQFGLALLGLVLVTGLWTALCTLLSLRCNTPNAASVLWAMLLVGSAALGTVLAGVLQQPWLASSLGVWEAGGVLVRALAGATQPDTSPAGAAATLGGLLLLLGLGARRRLRLAEALG